MPKQFTNEQLTLFFLGAKKHRCYQDTLDQYQPLQIHAEGQVPTLLINERRPSESETTMQYRKKIYVAKTKNPLGKVIKSLSKIRRSPDWSIKYDEDAISPRIVEGERLQDYCESNYPGHTSVTNWAFSVLLKNMCIDPNAVVMVVPMNLEAVTTNDYYKPVATLFNSDQVIFYEDWADFAIFESHEKSDLQKDDGTNWYQAGKVFYVVTTTEYEKWEQVNLGGVYQRTQYLLHNKNVLPCFKVKSPFLKQKEGCTIQESHIAPMLPSLNEAAREYSDLQASVVQHMHPLFWYYTNKSCPTCNGTGKVIDQTSQIPCTKDCTICNGTGKVKFSPYSHLEVDPPKLGEQATPTPPAGYIGRDVEIMKLQDERVKGHLFDALASVNMQFLDQTPLTISGQAKQVDREELNNFVYNFAEDIVATVDSIYWWVCEWRYSVIVPDVQARKAMLPQIVVPQNFDLLPADYLIEEIGKGKAAKVSPLLLGTLEEDYAVKKFYNNPELAGTVRLYYELDPLPGIEQADKMSMLMNSGITKEDYVTSNYIVSFVKQAIFDNGLDFMNMPLDAQKKIIAAYAQEKMKVTSAAEQVKQKLLQAQVQQANNGGNGNTNNNQQTAA